MHVCMCAGELIRRHLWDEESGAFVNRFPSGGFNRRVSPTSFYPMLAGAATADQADTMVLICIYIYIYVYIDMHMCMCVHVPCPMLAGAATA